MVPITANNRYKNGGIFILHHLFTILLTLQISVHCIIQIKFGLASKGL